MKRLGFLMLITFLTARYRRWVPGRPAVYSGGTLRGWVWAEVPKGKD